LPSDPGGERLAAAPFLTTIPRELEDPAVRVPARTSRFRFGVGAGAEELPDWWPGNEDPLVYLTFGSVAAGEHLPYYPALYRLAIDALSPLPVRVLVTVGDAAREIEELGKVPSNARIETWVAHDDVARRADVIVCHGGFGSTLGALAHGTPLVILPLSAAINGRTVRPLPARVPASRLGTTAAPATSLICPEPRRYAGSPARSVRSSTIPLIGVRPVASPMP
jgi:Glycosyltransferase family 28 C-terminal domain